eukprot:TRINITY_DN21924_c0_g1_i1.p1 TRINITY_DN21924_c0_g1~~TRINITY_DN21924_c0_g1_i1.p1  ORF type:complete len:271 (+),score=38.61 TRINITY_DN21924_c0_g1_i1:69-881(+)
MSEKAENDHATTAVFRTSDTANAVGSPTTLSHTSRKVRASVKQEKIKQDMEKIGQLIAALIASGADFEDERVKLLVTQSEQFERELKRLQQNQARQQRFRDKKKKQEQETQDQLSGYGFSPPMSSSSSPTASASPLPSDATTCNQEAVRSHLHLIDFTPEQWKELERSYPVLNACPMIALPSEISDKADSEKNNHFQCELVFLSRIRQLLSVPDQTQISRDVSTLLDLRQVFLKDAARYGTRAARMIVYWMVVCHHHLSEGEKSTLFNDS